MYPTGFHYAALCRDRWDPESFEWKKEYALIILWLIIWSKIKDHRDNLWLTFISFLLGISVALMFVSVQKHIHS